VDLSGKIAIVTGGAVRLGRAISLALAEEGVRVVVHYHASADEAERTVAEIRACGADAVTVQADFTDPVPAARTVIEAAVSHFGRADILVNSAAIFADASFATTTEEEWDQHVAINLKAPFFLCQAFAQRLERGQRAHIVNIADHRATRPGTDHPAYTVTKAGLVTLTKILARELAPNVQVNAIVPGAILPPPGADGGYLDRLAETIPLRRTGSPADITDALRLLLRSDFITGETLHVTGGEQL
jgi:NAD(P)-dependent dehydrogenase (short-subunit alcohol dehydrogenase family)